MRSAARLGGIRPGAVFVPFRYWDRESARDEDGELTRAANELTVKAWDPVSKQPIYKTTAVKVSKLTDVEG